VIGGRRNSPYDPYTLEELPFNQRSLLVRFLSLVYLLLDCLFGLPVDIIPELMTVCSLSSSVSYPAHLMRIRRTLARLRDALIQSAYLIISISRASAISFKDFASDSVLGRTASTTSWFIIAARSDPPGYRIAGSWIKIDGISGL
jgi:hypothetical protein